MIADLVLTTLATVIIWLPTVSDIDVIANVYCITRVNDTLIVLNSNEKAFSIKDGLILLDNRVPPVACNWVQMIQW